MANATDIQNLYIAYFNRPADVAGLTYWTSGAQANFTLVQIAQSFSQQTEYASAFANFTTTQTVDALFKNLFNHSADAAGLAYWAGQINNGTFTIGQAAIAILAGATGADAATVAAKFAAASSFTAKMATNIPAQVVYKPNFGNNFLITKTWLAGVVDAASGANAVAAIDGIIAQMVNSDSAVVPSVPFSVYPGIVNTGTAGNDAFTATDATLLTPGTAINGNGGKDGLNLTSPFTDAIHPATVTGVPTLNLQQGGTMQKAIAFLDQFSTINDNGTADYESLYLGTVAQTLNLSNPSGSRTVHLGAPNQTVNQVTNTTGAVGIISTNANLVGATLKLSNATGGDGIAITDAGTASLSAAQLTNIYVIYLYAAENLTFSPSVDTEVYTGGSTSLNTLTTHKITVAQTYSQALNLTGSAYYLVRSAGTGAITYTGTGGALTVLDDQNPHTITSSVATIIDAGSNLGKGGQDTLNGTGTFVVNYFGRYPNSVIQDGGALTGSLTVNAAGDQTASVNESTSTGAVTVNLGGTGVLTLNTVATHSTTVNTVAGVNAALALAGTGNVTINNNASIGNLTVTGDAGLEIINLANSGGAVDKLTVSGSTLGNMASKLITINNFKASGADVLKTGINASSLGAINIATSDYANLASTIASTIANTTSSLQNGSAFLVTVAGGTAAGFYVLEHTAGTSVGSGDIIVKLTGSTGSVVAGDLQM